MATMTMAERATEGTSESVLASTSSEAAISSAVSSEATAVVAPLLALTAVREKEPVTGKPRPIEHAKLHATCAHSSCMGSTG